MEGFKQMNFTPTHTKTIVGRGNIPPQYAAKLTQEERELLATVTAYESTVTIYVLDADHDELFAYGVFGQDDQDTFTIYAANTYAPQVAKLALRSFLGAAQVMGKPLRVHTEKVAAMARLMGAENFTDGLDLDNLPMIKAA